MFRRLVNDDGAEYSKRTTGKKGSKCGKWTSGLTGRTMKATKHCAKPLVCYKNRCVEVDTLRPGQIATILNSVKTKTNNHSKRVFDQLKNKVNIRQPDEFGQYEAVAPEKPVYVTMTTSGYEPQEQFRLNLKKNLKKHLESQTSNNYGSYEEVGNNSLSTLEGSNNSGFGNSNNNARKIEYPPGLGHSQRFNNAKPISKPLPRPRMPKRNTKPTKRPAITWAPKNKPPKNTAFYRWVIDKSKPPIIGFQNRSKKHLWVPVRKRVTGGFKTRKNRKNKRKKYKKSKKRKFPVRNQVFV